MKAIAEGTIEWEFDPDFGYLVASSVPGFDDPELLAPRKLYERQGRPDEYQELVAKLKAERQEYMRQHAGIADGVVETLAKPAHATDQRRPKTQGADRRSGELAPARLACTPSFTPDTPRHVSAAPPGDGVRPPGAYGYLVESDSAG